MMAHVRAVVGRHKGEKNVARKALFFDVDGTLLSEVTHTVPESALEALAATRRAGNLVFINSGRTYSFLGEIESMVECDGLLCGCGTCVVENGKVIFQHRIRQDRGREIRKAMLRYGFDGILESTEGLYVRKERSWIPPLNEMRDRESFLIEDRWEDEVLEYDKFCVFADGNSDREGFFEFLSPDIQVIDRGNDFYECVPAGYSKATAIAWVLEHYGIEKKDAYVFGDSSNDLSMFEYATNAVLMEVHDKVLEPYATFVTKRVEDGGIAWAMKELGLV